MCVEKRLWHLIQICDGSVKIHNEAIIVEYLFDNRDKEILIPGELGLESGILLLRSVTDRPRGG